MKTLKIGGVPEHFNFPWKWALQENKFAAEEINLQWMDYPKGTGDMCRALREKELDIAIILTEGIVRDIIKGNNSKIVQVYVQSPLLWGIHVAKNSNYDHIDDLKGTFAAISQYGSGSHLMAYVNAENENWNLKNDLKFKVVEDLQGALKSLPAGDADYFMWEKFMTKPFVDKGIFRLIAEIPTPWPSFVIAVRNEVLHKNEKIIQSVLEIINSVTAGFKNIPKIEKIIAEHFNQKNEDVSNWLSITEWSNNTLTLNEIQNIQKHLLDLELIPEMVNSEKFIYQF